MEEEPVEQKCFDVQDGNDIKTTLLTNLPIENVQYPEHILPHELSVFSNSDGNLTINMIEHVTQVTEDG